MYIKHSGRILSLQTENTAGTHWALESLAYSALRNKASPFYFFGSGSDMGMNGSKSRGQAHVLMLGLDQSGKSTLLYKLKYNKSVVTVPTVGFNVETLETDRRSPGLTVWDVGGQRKMRPHWKHHYADTAGLMFVVDSADQGRLDEARKELHQVIKDDVWIKIIHMHKLSRLHCRIYYALH